MVREKYSGTIDERFGPTLAAEHLASEDGVEVHHDTLVAGRPKAESASAERDTGAEPLTQLGRMCATLGDQDYSGEFAAG